MPEPSKQRWKLKKEEKSLKYLHMSEISDKYLCTFGTPLFILNKESSEGTVALSCNYQSLSAKIQIMQAFLFFLHLNLAYLNNLLYLCSRKGQREQ